MKLSELATRLGLELRGDGGAEVFAPAPIEAAAPGMIIFVASAKYAPILKRSGAAAAAIVAAEFAHDAKCPVLISANPYADFARVIEIFFPPYRPAPGIDPTAKIAPDAKLGEGASIGAFAVIGAGVTIGARAVLHPHAVIYPNVRIGNDFTAHSHAVVREGCMIGDRVTLLDGAVIGADGFGYVEANGGLVKIPQVGIVVLEDEVEIGAKSTVDRATLGATILHRGVKLDDQVHIGHNCEIGEFTRFAAHVGIAGSTKIGKWCQFGGQVGCADHVKIGDRVMASAQSGLHGNIADGAIVAGTPHADMKYYRRYAALWWRIPELFRRVRAIENRTGVDRAG
ncbi:MAG TPA: UDP-3-O-(3-hydroxymyristoyl)glucosamine N-acyltransferase [Candidatus Binataceae bacterium]|nr:UDP-3-O-(3-hydroxymyristoyl)glucosamine N-acyltransferase [Candidatus Binataceae bacterium]